MEKLKALAANLGIYTPETQDAIKGLIAEGEALERFETMKATEGWKILSASIRQSILNKIVEKVKDDPEINAWLAVLNTAATKDARATLEEHVNAIVPQE